jgi:hypothetical protein
MGDFNRPAAVEKRGAHLQPYLDRFKQLKKEQRVDMFSAKSFAGKARENKLWIYSPDNKTWYTPEEFVTVYERYHGQDKWVQSMQLRDPFEGIEAAYRQMDNLQSRAKVFTKRVLDYFNK